MLPGLISSENCEGKIFDRPTLLDFQETCVPCLFICICVYDQISQFYNLMKSDLNENWNSYEKCCLVVKLI